MPVKTGRPPGPAKKLRRDAHRAVKVLAMHDLHPDWSTKQLAEATGAVWRSIPRILDRWRPGWR